MKVFLALAVIAKVASAQPSPPTPAAALANVEATYKKPAQLTSSFEQSIEYKATGITGKSSGWVWVSKPDKIRFDYVAKDPKRRRLDKQFLFDGATLSLIDHKNSEVTQKPATGTDLPVLVKFFTGAGSLTTEFTVAADKTRVVPGALVLQLMPKKPNASYSELYLVIDPAAWTVTKTIVINSSGDTNTITFSKIDTTKTQPADWFQVPKSTAGYKQTIVKP